LAGNLYGFRNMRSWGKWEIERVNEASGEIINPAAWSLADLNSEAKKEFDNLNVAAVHSLGESRCPIDGLPISWTKPELICSLNKADIMTDYGAGYYRLQDMPVFDDKLRCENRAMFLTRKLNLALAEINAWASFEPCLDDALLTALGDTLPVAAGPLPVLVHDVQDLTIIEGGKNMPDGYYHCAHCNVPIHKLHDCLIVNGILVAYCQAADCQESMKESAGWFKKHNIRVRKEVQTI
jgi:hypothetical protein